MNIKRSAAEYRVRICSRSHRQQIGKVVGGRRWEGGREERVVPLPERVHVLLYYLRKFLTSYKFPTFVIYVFKVASLTLRRDVIIEYERSYSYRRVKSILPVVLSTFKIIGQGRSLYIYVYPPFDNFMQMIISLFKDLLYIFIHQDINQFLFKNK